MIYVRLRGNIGQGLFQIYFASVLAKELDQEIALYYNGSLNNFKYGWLKVKDSELFSKFNFIEKYPSYLPVIFEKGLDETYESIKTRVKTSLEKYNMAAIEGWFQNEECFDTDKMKALYKPSEEKLKSLREKYEITENTLCVSAMCSVTLLERYFKLKSSADIMKMYDEWDGDKKYDKIIVVSNRPKDCKIYYENILPEKTVFVETDNIEELIYIPGLCKDIMISFDAISWWGALLSDFKHKDIDMPIRPGTMNFPVRINNKKFLETDESGFVWCPQNGK